MSRIFEMSFAAVYPHYVTKVEKKGRTQAERKIRYLDKLVDELARGKAMEKVLRD